MSLKNFLILTLFLVTKPLQGKKGFGPGDQEWGYVTVRPRAHMFWWLYRTTAIEKDKPLIIWLQGGPGVSGTAFGNFAELGPTDTKLQPRNHTWIKDYNVVFIDNPVGTGFSYVENFSDLCKNNQQVVQDLMVLVKEFFRQFPEFKKIPTFLFAESYGGKYAVEFANLWYKEQEKKSVISNFKGVGLIDSFISPNDMYKSMAPFLLNTGMIDSNGYKELDDAANEFAKAGKVGDWSRVVTLSFKIEYMMQKLTHEINRYSVIEKVKPFESFKFLAPELSIYELIDENGYKQFDDATSKLVEASKVGDWFQVAKISSRIDNLLNKLTVSNKLKPDNFSILEKSSENLISVYSPDLVKLMSSVKEVLGLRSNFSAQENYVKQALLLDTYKPVTYQVEKLLNETSLKVFVVNGQLDVIITTPGTLSWLEKLNWKHSQSWLSALRLPLVVNDTIEGYSKQYGNLKFYWVNRSGHMVPADNPVAMKHILRDLIYSKN